MGVGWGIDRFMLVTELIHGEEMHDLLLLHVAPWSNRIFGLIKVQGGPFKTSPSLVRALRSGQLLNGPPYIFRAENNYYHTW